MAKQPELAPVEISKHTAKRLRAYQHNNPLHPPIKSIVHLAVNDWLDREEKEKNATRKGN